LVKEQFGTAPTAIYHKLFYNSRGQLAEIRAGTSYTGPADHTADRGAIVNNYSNNCTGDCSGSSMTDNNGNLRKQEIHIPGQTMRYQEYVYDSLNRLNSVREVLDGGAEQWKQGFTYDRWGNRTINTGVTYGVGINNKAFNVNTTNNRLEAPSGQSGTMTYDSVGNLTNDTYTGAGNRTYDAENKITSAWGGNNQAQLYSYDAMGQRITRTIDGVETVQVYGFGGELLAEYAATAETVNPQKEYGYRNGQLVITAEPRKNFALTANGGTATASSQVSTNYPAYSTINGDRRGLNWNNGGGWNDGTINTHPDWLQIDFNGNKTIDEINVITLQDNPATPAEPTESMTFTLYGLTGYSVQYWNGSAWTTVTGGTVSGNNKVWKKFTFPAITATKIRVLTSSSADAYSRITEVEAWGHEAPAARTNFALNGLTSASSTINANYPAFSTINGDRRGLNWNFGGGWNDSTINTHPDWLQIDFNGSKTIDEIDVFTLQDTPATPAEPTESMTFTLYGLTGYSVQYWNGSTWVTVSGGAVTGNNKVWRKFTFSPITTTKIRVLTSSSPDAYSRLTEVEAWGPMEPVASAGVKWLLADHLGTPRMVIDETGDLANMTRHDYLPFGEELFAPTGGRTTTMGYTNSDKVRQQFTSKERDVETGLDYFLARYYSSIQGRFTSPDEFKGGPEELFGKVDPHDPLFYADLAEPQSLNKYHYALNNPLRYIDPDGHQTAAADALKIGAVLTAIPTIPTKIVGGVIIGGVIGYTVYQNRAEIDAVFRNAKAEGGASAMQQDMADLRRLRQANKPSDSSNQGGQQGQSNTANPNPNGGDKDKKPVFGEKGTQTTSKTMGQGKGWRVDVENPNPGQRPGQIHYQSGNTKLLYDPVTKSFVGASKSLNKQLMNDPQIQKAIEKGMKLLGESQ
jgi:RHS repeat-associated protein